MKKLSWVVIFALGASGCNSDSKNQEGAVPPPLSQIELYHSDYASLSAISGDTLSPFESLKPGLLSKIFGGMDGPAFVTYFNARVHYVYQQDADVSISPQSFTHTNWSKVATAESGVVMGAVNLGTALWFMGLLDRTPVTLFAGGETIPLNSSRTGLVILGPGYKERSMRLEDGSAANVPPAYRQATLMHEARHSDCTGGIRQQDLEVARAATNRDECQ